MRTITAALVAAAALTVSACGTVEDTARPAAAPTSESAAASTSPSATASPGTDAYTTTSDVVPHAAIGKDLSAIRTLLAAAKDGGAVDWSAVEKVFREGGASKKGDGSLRTLAALSPDSAAVPIVESALAGTGGGSDAARAQQVDKGVVVHLAEKVIGELESATEKVGKGETDPATGAPHNVDEAYAFFVADGEGPAATADKREKKPELAGKVRGPVVEALSAAQTAAAAGDAAGLTAATAQAQAALDYLFYLAVHRYLDHQGDDVAQAEGGAFYLGIAPRVKAASPAADAAILATLGGSGDAQSGRAALDSPEVFTALGLAADQKATTTPS
jgi:hypothetical protein